MSPPQSTRALLDAAAAAAYCGCSRRHFEREVAPWVPVVDLRGAGRGKPMPRYLRSDLDIFILARRRDPDAVEGRAA